MKYNKDWKVVFCWEYVTDKRRYYYWRIAKQELNIFQRLFSNPWHRLEKACLDDWNPCFNPDTYKEFIQPIKTYGDIVSFEEQEWKKIKAIRQKYIDQGIIFPDEYD